MTNVVICIYGVLIVFAISRAANKISGKLDKVISLLKEIKELK